MKNKGIFALLGVAGVFFIIFIIFYLWGGSVYDGAVNRQETVKEKWGNVQTAYQNRADLIPNLVATVKGAAQNEKEILIGVVDSRSGVAGLKEMIKNAQTPSEMIAPAGKVNRAFNILFERYPNIKSTANFSQLQSQLESTENQVSFARIKYNEAVKEYNSHIRGFFKKKALGLLGEDEDDFTRREAFEAEETSQDVPKVEF